MVVIVSNTQVSRNVLKDRLCESKGDADCIGHGFLESSDERLWRASAGRRRQSESGQRPRVVTMSVR